MDLVDIDQVLDNLELSVAADERAQATATTTTAALAVNATSLAEGRVQGDGASGRNFGKNFIGVSQVFNSLDDYSNNVKSLVDTTKHNYDWQPRDYEEDETGAINNAENASNSDNAENVDKVENVKYAAHTTSRLDEDDEISNSMDIHKFKEHVSETNVHLNVDDPAITTSDSLTTSSCSTFSSGPSLGCATNTDDAVIPSPSSALPESAVELPQRITDEPKPCDVHLGTEQNPSQSEISQSIENKNFGVEDLAVGMSSISITTASQSILPCEVTASSDLIRVLNELSESEEFSSQSTQEEFVQSAKVMPITVTESELHVVSESTDHTDICTVDELPKNISKATPEINKQIKPVTFCSTMDDISDTELDSMLQEMDIDDVDEQDNGNKMNSTTVMIVPSDMSAISEPETTQSADQINADNFSQASTVEFAEIKAEAAVRETEQKEESISSSYDSTTDSDCVSDGKVVNRQYINELEARQRPERPRTLDLTTLNTQFYGNTDQTSPIDEIVNQGPGGDSVENNVTNDASINEEDSDGIAEAVGYSDPHANLGKVPPIWVPDNMANGCMQCQQKFTMIKRRHHCRACGKVLCSTCCSQKCKLGFLPEPESRCCVQCYLILSQRQNINIGNDDISDVREPEIQNLPPTPMRSPNPNNPMEYCSTIPPHRQVSASTGAPPPSVIVPVGVLKKDGSYSSNSSNSIGQKTRKPKSVMFSDGIAPGSELASSIEQQWADAKQARRVDKNRSTTATMSTSSATSNKLATPTSNETRNIETTTMGLVAQLFRGSIPPMAAASTVSVAQSASESVQISKESKPLMHNSPRRKVETQRSKKLPAGFDPQGCFIPYEEDALPPICVPSREDSICDFDYKEVKNDFDLVERLQKVTLKFIVKNNFYVYVKIAHLNCCMNRTVINFTTFGMHHVGNDEIIILLEYKPPLKRENFVEPAIPKDVFIHLHELYCEAEHGRPIAELSFTSPKTNNFLNSREYGGFIYIRSTYQCLQELILPECPFLFGVLIHRHEIAWAKIFPLRLMLRLGAQYRYYPCPLISIRNRESVYAEIAQTIINFLADFRNYSYTLPTIRGMHIHMEDRETTVLIPRNRQEDINKAINNASDHILAFAGNFSKSADGHLVCMQNVNDDHSELYAYSTQAINIQGQPRKVTGASFFVLNEALKSTSGLSGKCSIVEDGLMVQILPSKMEEVRNALRNQTDINIVCGPIDANDQQTEIVSIKWVDNDRDFNIGVKSPIDDKSMQGISSMRVHASFNYSNDNYSIRLTDIYIIKFDEWYTATQTSIAASSTDITRISEQIARSASMALIPYLDLLAAASITKVALRATLHQDNVCYEAGARGVKLAPLYMNALDNHLIPTLHNESSGIEDAIILELIFYILNV